jgi:hypothetical protein
LLYYTSEDCTSASKPWTATIGRQPFCASFHIAVFAPAYPQQIAKNNVPPKQQERKTPLAGFEIGFTPSNELLISRLSMLGFGSAVVGEFLTGQGVLAQLGYELGLQQVRT